MTAPRGAVRRIEHSLHFIAIEKAENGTIEALCWDGEDPLHDG